MIELDCGDQNCLFATDKSGMRTNGGCRCIPPGHSRLSLKVQEILNEGKRKDATISSLREEIACLKAELTKLNNWSDQLWKIVSPQDPAITDGIYAMGTRSERQVVTSDPTSPAIDVESGLLSECEECNCQIKINRALLRKNNTLKSRALLAEAEVEKLKGSICNCKS